MKSTRFGQSELTASFGAVLFLFFGLLLTPWMLWSRYRVEAMRTWPTVKAVVVSADVRQVHHKNEGYRYRHEISYRYTVEGTGYTGSQVSYGGRPPEWTTESQARETLPQPGAAIAVSYNPRDPQDSVIQVIYTPASEVFYVIGVCGFVGLFGAVLMGAGIYRMRTGT